jgi:XTP/dITP diphosphohydrolase
MSKLLLATNNPGKVKEMHAILAPLQLELLTPSQAGIHLDVLEDGQTYAENASRKALAFARASHLITLADDSGLEVDLLNDEPGLHSHRFAPWLDATDADRRRYLLQKLQSLPKPWKAHFHCTVAIATTDNRIFYAEGDCPGEIIPMERGSNGFGYDPIFFLPEFQATMAELDPALKNQISHRARAMTAAFPLLRQIFNINFDKPG